MGLPPETTGSTMPRRRLGRQLRELRNRAGMTTRVAARRLEWSEAKIWRIETGQTSLRGLDVEAMCKVYDAPDDTVAPLTALAKETKARGWWTAYSEVIAEGFEVYLGLEEAAASLSNYEEQLIPGLLQTEAYARALLRAARPELPVAKLERRVQLRMARQELLTKEQSPLQLNTVIGEAALRRRIGDETVAEEQFDRLRTVAALPNVRVQVLPDVSGYHAGIEAGRFALLQFAVPDGAPEPPVVYIEAFSGPLYSDKPPDTGRYGRVFDAVAAAALDMDEGLALVQRTS